MVPLVPYTSAEAQQVLDTNCAPCHTTNNTFPNVSDVLALQNAVSNQSMLRQIEAGNHQASYLWHKINGSHRTPEAGGRGALMPRNRLALSQEIIDRFALWIDGLPGQP